MRKRIQRQFIFIAITAILLTLLTFAFIFYNLYGKEVSEEVGNIWAFYRENLGLLLVFTVVLMLVGTVLVKIFTGSILNPLITTIQQQHEDIVKNSNMRQVFTANISHELKTPLTAISGYSELIANGMTTEEDTKRFAEEIHKSSKRLVTLINDSIRLSELDLSEREVTMEPVDLYEVAKNCIDMLQINAKSNNVTLTMTGIPCVVSANRDMMVELIYNLCDNAIRYNVPGGSVVVTVYRDEKQGMLSVADTGIGIPKEEQEHIFERFYRVDKSRSKLTGGTGLGLAIVKHMVSILNAKLELESEMGEGTTFRIIFEETV